MYIYKVEELLEQAQCLSKEEAGLVCVFCEKGILLLCTTHK